MRENEEIARGKMNIQDFRSPFVLKKSFYEPMIAKSGPYLHGHVGLIWEPG